MRQKKLVIGLLVMLAVLVSGFTYAYWATVTAPADDTAVGTITIGEGGTVSTTVVVADASGDNPLLVPTAYGVAGTDDTSELTFSVNWSGGAGSAGAAGTLAVDVTSYTLNGLSEAEIDAMFTITVTSGTGAIVAGTPQNVVVTVVFTTEPATQAIYDLVATQSLAVTLTFSVTLPA